jgi:hypothetical protein
VRIAESQHGKNAVQQICEDPDGTLKKQTICETMAGNGGYMAQVRTQELLELVRDTQTNLLDYLRRADERQERQNHAVLTALGEIQKGQESIARLVLQQSEMLRQQSEMLRDMHAMTTRVMEQSNQILLQLGGSGTTH